MGIGVPRRALAYCTSQRNASLPDVPTIAESGFAGFEAPAWWAVLASAKTPPEIVARLNAEIVKALKDPAVLERLGDYEIYGSSPEEFGAFLVRENEKWSAVARAGNIKVD